MQDPVLCADEQTYERVAIAEWLDGHDTSPLNGEPLAHRQLTPNRALKQLLEAAQYQVHQAAAAAGMNEP